MFRSAETTLVKPPPIQRVASLSYFYASVVHYFFVLCDARRKNANVGIGGVKNRSLRSNRFLEKTTDLAKDWNLKIEFYNVTHHMLRAIGD